MIDWDRVTQLQDEVGEDDFQEVVDIFLDEMNEELETLVPGMTAKELEAKLHSLKGAALNLGFSQFAELCRVGEETARGGQTDSIDTAAITSCYRASMEEFSDIRSDGAAA